MMPTPRLNFITCASPAGLHRMAYWEWGEADNDAVLVSVHGLTRSGRDFDKLARQLAPHFRVVCPDVVGRGASDWLANPACYTVAQYAADMATLVARLNPATLHWVGTSMGGLIGLAFGGGLMALAGNRHNRAPDLAARVAQRTPRLASLVLNDVGPSLAASALLRIGTYLAEPVALASFDDAVQYVKRVSAGFGAHSDEEWSQLTRYVFVERAGTAGPVWVKHYDTRLALAFADPAAASAGEPILWQAYRALDCPILILRGAQSDLLTPATVQAMLAARKHSTARVQVHEFADVGHAPTLLHEDQCRVVREFLLACP